MVILLCLDGWTSLCCNGGLRLINDTNIESVVSSTESDKLAFKGYINKNNLGPGDPFLDMNSDPSSLDQQQALKPGFPSFNRADIINQTNTAIIWQ